MSLEQKIDNARNIIRMYSAKMKAAEARRDMLRARGYGERIRMWIQILENYGALTDGDMSAWRIARTVIA